MAKISLVTGHYVTFEVDGLEYRVFWCENGHGPPLVCHHTAVTQATAEQVAGAEYIEMKNLGHFPMSENYPLFKPYLTQALDIIERKLAASVS